MLQNIKG